MSNSQTATTETLRSLANGSITTSFVAVGTALANPARMVIITNNTDGDMFFSDDGSNNKFFVPKNSFLLLDLCTNRVNVDQMFVYPQGTQFYVKYSSSPSQGAVYIAVIYGIRSSPLQPGGL